MEDLYLVKFANMLKAPQQLQLSDRYAGDGLWNEVLWGLLDWALWLLPFCALVSLLRYILFGDFVLCWNTAALVSGHYFARGSMLFPIVLGAPLRLATENVSQNMHSVGCVLAEQKSR